MTDNKTTQPLETLLATVSPGVLAAATNLAQAICKDLEAKKSSPPKSEDETLVDIANSLPQEVLTVSEHRWPGSSWRSGTFWLLGFSRDAVGYVYDNDTSGAGDIGAFYHRLLGVMSEYVGTEVRAKVARCSGSERGRVGWCAGKSCEWITVEHSPIDWLIGHRDCCLSIAERRAKA